MEWMWRKVGLEAVLEASCLQAASSPVPPGGLRKASLVGASLDRRWVSSPCSPSVFSLDVVQAFPFSPPLLFSTPVTENHLEQVWRCGIQIDSLKASLYFSHLCIWNDRGVIKFVAEVIITKYLRCMQLIQSRCQVLLDAGCRLSSEVLQVAGGRMQLLTFAALVVAAASSPVPSQKVTFVVIRPLGPWFLSHLLWPPVVQSLGPLLTHSCLILRIDSFEWGYLPNTKFEWPI